MCFLYRYSLYSCIDYGILYLFTSTNNTLWNFEEISKHAWIRTHATQLYIQQIILISILLQLDEKETNQIY